MRPFPPFSRRDAILFLCQAGAIATMEASRADGKPPPREAAHAMAEALLAVGISHQEIRDMTLRGELGEPTAWDELLGRKFRDE